MVIIVNYNELQLLNKLSNSVLGLKVNSHNHCMIENSLLTLRSI